MSTATLETYVDLSRGRLETMLKVLDVDGAVRRVRGGWEATGQPWEYDAERHRRVRESRQRELQAMLDYLATDRCRMRFLREQLDDPEAADCGRCDNCGGLTLPTDISAGAVEAAGAQLARPGVAVEPRKLWPSGLAYLGIDLKGRIAEMADEGRAVARLTDLGYGNALRSLFAAGAEDGPVPDSLVRAVIEMLTEWRPPVDGIVAVESATRPRLTTGLAEGLSRYLQAPIMGRWAIVDPQVAPGQGAANSAQRVAAIGRRCALDADPDVLRDQRVLLVDDRTVSGWTLTLAARAALLAGAAEVRPLVLATTT